MTCKDRLETYLREQQVQYAIRRHRRTYTAHDTAVTEHIPADLVAKAVIVVADGRLTMLVLPASVKVDVVQVGSSIGAQEVRLAHEREFAHVFADCDVGALPPFGNLYGLPVYVERSLAADETIVFSAGTHTDTISMRYADFARLVKPTVAAFARRLIPGARAVVS